MKKYKIHVLRTGFSDTQFTVEAENPEQAKEKASELAGNHEFSEYHAEYDCDILSGDEDQPLEPYLQVTVTGDYVEILNHGEPFLYWESSEWENEPSILPSVTNAVHLAHTDPKKLINLLQQ